MHSRDALAAGAGGQSNRLSRVIVIRPLEQDVHVSARSPFAGMVVAVIEELAAIVAIAEGQGVRVEPAPDRFRISTPRRRMRQIHIPKHARLPGLREQGRQQAPNPAGR